MPFIVTRCTTLCHLSFVVPLALIRCHSLYHSLSLVVTRCSDIQEDVVINDQEQEKFMLDILSRYITVMNQRLDKLVTEIKNNNARLDDLNEVIVDLKLSSET